MLGFSGGSAVKDLPAMQEQQVQSLGREEPLAKGTTTHSSTLARRILWAEEPGGLQLIGSQGVKHKGTHLVPEQTRDEASMCHGAGLEPYSSDSCLPRVPLEFCKSLEPTASKAAVPNLFDTRNHFRGRQFIHRQCEGMISVNYIYWALYFYYYYISSISDHQA